MPKWCDRYHEVGAKTSCTLRATNQVANCGQKAADCHRNLARRDEFVYGGRNNQGSEAVCYGIQVQPFHGPVLYNNKTCRFDNAR